MSDNPPLAEEAPPQEPPKKKRGRPKGSKNKKKKQPVPWFKVWRAGFWASVSVLVIVSTYQGVRGFFGDSAGHLSLAVVTLLAALALDRDWKKMRK